MRLPFVFICFAFAATCSGQSFWDSVPIVSQVKSLVQAASGDTEGAKKTQENFVQTAPVVSQITSAVQSAQGDNEGAKKTQEKFLQNVEAVVDSTPVLGHIKGGIHIGLGEKEKGEEILKGASSTTGAVIGGLLGGPGGAILGQAATDALITGVDSAVNKEFKPMGLVDYVVNFGDKDAGEHFDQIFGIAADVAGGSAAKKPSKTKGKPDAPNRAPDVDVPDRRPDSPQFGAEPPHRGGIDEHFIHQWDENDMQIDFSRQETLAIARSRVNLPDEFRNRLELFDFRDVNDVDGTNNCYFCTAAAMRDIPVTEMMDRYNIRPDEVRNNLGMDGIMDVYRRVGFEDIHVNFQGNIFAFDNYVSSQLAPGTSASFALAFTRVDGTGHVVFMRVWKNRDQNIKVNYLITDFQKGVRNPERFSSRLPVNARVFYILLSNTVNTLKEADIVNAVDPVMMSDLKAGPMKNNCNGKRAIGYLANWAKKEFTVKQAVRLTNVIYAFIQMDAGGGLTIPTNTMAKQRLLDAFVARKALDLKGFKLPISFAVGGWENSQYFSNVIANNQLRSQFIRNILTVLNDYKFDGVDIDWEYPGTGGATNGTKADKANYVAFLKELREKVGNEKLISIAAAAGEEAMQGFDIKNIVKYVDWIGVMSYDLNGAWDSKWGAFVGPNAPLYHGAPIGYSGKLNVDWAIKQYVCKSKMPQKIVMGLPFYGRYWTKTVDGVDSAKYPLFRKAEPVAGKYGGDMSYRDLIRTWLSKGSGFKINWDDRTKTPWGMRGANNLILSYDNPRSIREKVSYSVRANLGGVMIWSLDQDDDQLSLTNSISEVCTPTGKSVNFKCNPLEERRWWTYAEDKDKAGMCGKSAPLYKGFYAVCDPDDPGYGCCSSMGYCGSGPKHCSCEGCVDYTKNPQKLIAEPVKPSRKVAWHVGFDKVKPGKPRCGPQAPPINGFHPICNPDDDASHCCAPSGYCGTGADFCACKGCKDFKKIPEAQSLKKATPASQIRWHVGFDVVMPGKPRCGPLAPKIKGQTAICDPSDDSGYCCSQWGFCGSGKDFCDCKECINSRNQG